MQLLIHIVLTKLLIITVDNQHINISIQFNIKMPKRHKFECNVPNCKSEWMLASWRRLQFCEDHYYKALDLYYKYKKHSNDALEKFDDDNLQQAIKLREQYGIEFVGYDHGAHKAFVDLLKQLLQMKFCDRKKVIVGMLNDFNEDYLTK